MTPQAALKKVKGSDKTLDQVRLLLKKEKKIVVSVPTLSRIQANAKYQPGYKLTLALMEMAQAGTQ